MVPNIEHLSTSAISFTELDHGSGIIILKSILTTFRSKSHFFRGSWGSFKNWLELKIGKFSLSNFSQIYKIFTFFQRNGKFVSQTQILHLLSWVLSIHHSYEWSSEKSVYFSYWLLRRWMWWWQLLQVWFIFPNLYSYSHCYDHYYTVCFANLGKLNLLMVVQF